MIRTVVITGGIGSGKSVVCRYLASRGVPVYDADSAAKRLYSEDKALVLSLAREFGTGILNAVGNIDKDALAKIIFSSEVALAKLESIVHPAVLADFIQWRSGHEQDEWCGYSGPEPFVVIESAIILEKRLFEHCYDSVILVEAPEEIRLLRVQQRDGRGEEEIKARMSMQKFDINAADAIICNDSGIDELYKKTDLAFITLYLHNKNKKSRQ